MSHVSGPEAIWIEEEHKLFLYYHGENNVTRLASSTNGIDFQYEGVAVTADMFDRISEASYARVFRYTLPGQDNRYIMLLMGNNEGTRKIYLASSSDGRKWEPRRTPLLTPPPGTSQVAQAWYFPWQGKHYLIYHAHEAGNETYASLHVSEVDAAFEHTQHLGVFYDRTSVSPDNVAQMSPCFVTEGNRLYLFTNIGPRLNQKIALAVADIPLRRDARSCVSIPPSCVRAVEGRYRPVTEDSRPHRPEDPIAVSVHNFRGLPSWPVPCRPPSSIWFWPQL